MMKEREGQSYFVGRVCFGLVIVPSFTGLTYRPKFSVLYWPKAQVLLPRMLNRSPSLGQAATATAIESNCNCKRLQLQLQLQTNSSEPQRAATATATETAIAAQAWASR
jgi:hypothetical protein